VELLLEPSHWAMLALVGLFAGFIDAVVGGGGLLSIPALLTIGMPPHIALGTNKLAACFGSFTASLTYYKQQLFVPSFWYHSLGATFVGAVIGTLAVFLVDSQWLEKILPILIIGIALYTLVSPKIMDASQQAPKMPSSAAKQWTQGLGLGAYDGFAGPGIGAFWTLSSIKLHKLPLLNSCGLARAMTSISNATALILFAVLGQVHWMLGLWIGICMMVGAYIGAHSAIRFGVPFIKPLFIIMVLAMGANLTWTAWQ
jgi:uncharacterized protein